MPIADKLLYLNDTKTALADAINVALSARGEAPLDANATFRSYAERLFYPGYLFGQGEQGGYYLPPNAEAYFTDTAGTTPAALGGAVALVQGEVGPDWTQGTATARPLWAREPEGGRRNEWNVSDSPTVGVVVAGTTFEPEPGELGTGRLTSISGGGLFYKLFRPGRTTRYSVEVRAGTADRVQLDWNGYSPALFDVSAGEVVSGNTAIITPAGDGWWRVSSASSLLSGNYQAWVLRIPEAQAGDYVLVRKPQVEQLVSPSDPPTPYQQVTTQYDITEPGVPDVPYVRFDLVDDVLTTTLPAATYTVALPARQGIWIDSVEHAGGSFSIGPTSYTGGPAGILTALESDGVAKLVAPPLVIDRALTDTERSALVRWYQARGAGPELELGPELVVNGTFDTADVWTFDYQGSISGGRANMTRDSGVGTNCEMWQPVTSQSGGNYLITVDIEERQVLGLRVNLASFNGRYGPSVLFTSTGVSSAIFTPPAAAGRINVIAVGVGGDGNRVILDSISARRIQPKVSP